MKEYNYIQQHLLLLTWILYPLHQIYLVFFICCDNTMFFTTINWIVNASKFIYTFPSSLFIMCRHLNINLDRKQFIPSYTSSSIEDGILCWFLFHFLFHHWHRQWRCTKSIRLKKRYHYYAWKQHFHCQLRTYHI